MSNILMVIAPEGFRDEELFVPEDVFIRKGHSVSVSSTRTGECKGSRGGSATSEILLRDVDTDRYDAVIFVGGGGSRVLFNDMDAQRIAREMHADGKVAAAICIAPVILANAGLLKGRNATVFDSEAETIRGKGARYTGDGVTVDGNIVTGDSPKSAKLFAEKVCDLLK
jgi:protease I